MSKTDLCMIRKDLLADGLSVPIGNMYVSTRSNLKYRWRGKGFQIFYNQQWLNAQSIDFDFIN